MPYEYQVTIERLNGLTDVFVLYGTSQKEALAYVKNAYRKQQVISVLRKGGAEAGCEHAAARATLAAVTAWR